MSTRLRLLQGATALLYIGPLLAGLAGHGWSMAAPFLALFVLWSILMRPHLWPRPAEALRLEAVIPLTALIATQALLVALLFALGAGFGGVTGLRLGLPFWFPAALSLAAVPLSRLLWRAEESPRGFDPLSHRLSPAGPEGTGPLIAALAHLPAEASELDLQAHLMATEADAQAIRAALDQATGPAVARARIVLATDPDLAADLCGARYAARLFPPAPGDMALFASRALRAMEDEPTLAADFPPPEALETAAASAPEAAPALMRLAGLIRAASTRG